MYQVFLLRDLMLIVCMDGFVRQGRVLVRVVC